MPDRKQVVFGFVGAVLDSGVGASRWERWRPSVALCQHEDMLVDRLELLYQRKFTRLAETIQQDARSVSPETTVNLHLVEFEDPWDFEEVYGSLLDFAHGYRFEPEREDYLAHITTGTHVAQICLFLLNESRQLPGRLLQTAPPPRKGSQQPGSFRIIDLDLSKYDRLAQRFLRQQREDLSMLKSGIDTRNAAFNELITQIEHVASHSRAPILLTGPTGAGKSHLARRIFELKHQRQRVEGRFIEVNCATLRGDGAMSALFGHKRGAFTGAVSDRPGLLSSSDGGVLFLDEVGELGLDEQAMLLRALEEKRFLPVGADREVEGDFQLIAGTNRDLAVCVRDGRFREDLLARMNLWTFRLPGLAERREDIEPNVRYELDQYAARTGTSVTFNKEARERFMRFALSAEATWAANFRDLSGAITRMGTLAPAGRINLEIVDQEIERLRSAWRSAGVDDAQSICDARLGTDRAAKLDRADTVQLAEVIRVCQMSKSIADASRSLFAVSRLSRTTTNDSDRLRKYLSRFGLTWAQLRKGE